jgi:hypothetical protein
MKFQDYAPVMQQNVVALSRLFINGWFNPFTLKANSNVKVNKTRNVLSVV